MAKSLVVKDRKRGSTLSLSVFAAGVVAVSTFLLLTPHDSHEHTAPTPEAAALSPSTPAPTDAVDLVAYCAPTENGPAEIDYQRLDALGIERTAVDQAMASLIH